MTISLRLITQTLIRKHFALLLIVDGVTVRVVSAAEHGKLLFIILSLQERDLTSDTKKSGAWLLMEIQTFYWRLPDLVKHMVKHKQPFLFHLCNSIMIDGHRLLPVGVTRNSFRVTYFPPNPFQNQTKVKFMQISENPHM